VTALGWAELLGFSVVFAWITHEIRSIREWTHVLEARLWTMTLPRSVNQECDAITRRRIQHHITTLIALIFALILGIIVLAGK
jgi:hypothetical protein